MLKQRGEELANLVGKGVVQFVPSPYAGSGNLRDHMTDLELIFTILGEASTTDIAQTEDAIGFEQNRNVARRGGTVAGKAREYHEKETGRRVSTKKNYLGLSKNFGLLK